MSFSLSNYLYQRAPDLYGGRQDAYLKRAEEAIAKGVQMIETARKSEEKVQNLFFQIITFFRQTRQSIAEEHQTENPELFGSLRYDKASFRHNMLTGLYLQYEEYNQIFMAQFASLMSGMKHDVEGFQEKMFSYEEKQDSRIVNFRIEILEKSDLDKIAEVGEKKIQEALATELPLEGICRNYPLMEDLRKRHLDMYESLLISGGLAEIIHKFPPPSKKQSLEANSANRQNSYALGSLYMEIDGKRYPLSRYVTWLYVDRVRDPVQTMELCSKAIVIHQDVFWIEETLQEISKIFDRIIFWDREKKSMQDLKNQVALIRFLYAHSMPCERGDGAVGDWLELAIYRSLGFKETQFDSKRLPCFEPLVSLSLSRYLREYDSIIQVR